MNKKVKNALNILLALIMVVGLLPVGAYAEGQVEADPVSLSFDSVQEGYASITPKPVTIRNNTAASVMIMSFGGLQAFEAMAMDASAQLVSLPYTLPAGESMNLAVWPKSDLAANDYSETLTVDYNDGAHKTLSVALSFTVTGTPPTPTGQVETDTVSLSFGSVQQGYDPITLKPVTILNNTAASVTISSLGCLQAFEATAMDANVQPVSLPYTLPADECMILAVYPKSDLAAGDYSETLTVAYNDGADKTLSVALSFKVTPTTKHTVTYIVMNGTWEDDTKTNKTEEVEDRQSPTQIPTGMKPAENYEGGAWSPDPNGATITGDTTFTYTFDVKNLDVVGRVIWVGDENQQDMRPEKIMVHLLANSRVRDSQEVKAGPSDLWTFSFDNLPAANAQGDIDYSITVDEILNYTTKVEKGSSGTLFVITNTLNGTVKPKHTVTYNVAGGIWADGSTTPKTEEVEDGQSPAQIPTGMLPDTNYEGGAWSPDPNGARITDNTTFTYSFTEKQNPPTPVTKHTVTYIVENGTWADGTTTPKTEEVEEGQSPAQIPTGMLPAENYEGGAWSPDPDGARITDNTTFTYTFTAKQNPPQPTKHTVTYNVVNGTWADGTTTPKTEEVKDGQSPSRIPTGMKPGENYEGGRWNPNPNGATITDNMTFTYSFTAKQNPPTPVTISYTAKDGSGNTIQSVTWQKGSGKSLDLTFKRSEDDHLTYGLFGSLEIGGVTVGSANYSAAEGSLKLSIKPEYLETLAVGDHTVKSHFKDGSATVKLTVLAASSQPTPSPTPMPSEKPTTPKTGDESNLALWNSLLFLSVVAMTVLLLYARKRKTGQ